jgi:hypothetical protein
MDNLKNSKNDGLYFPRNFKTNTTLPLGKYGDIEELERSLKKDPTIEFIEFENKKFFGK